MPTEPLPPLMEMALKLCYPHKDQSLHLAPTEMPGGNGLPVTLEFRRGGIPWASWLIRLAQSVSSSFMETTRRSLGRISITTGPRLQGVPSIMAVSDSRIFCHLHAAPEHVLLTVFPLLRVLVLKCLTTSM